MNKQKEFYDVCQRGNLKYAEELLSLPNNNINI